jgi:hypothetical protein
MTHSITKLMVKYQQALLLGAVLTMRIANLRFSALMSANHGIIIAV